MQVIKEAVVGADTWRLQSRLLRDCSRAWKAVQLLEQQTYKLLKERSSDPLCNS